MGETRRPTIVVRKWLADEEFRELLEVADYLGRTPSGSLFALNSAKVYDNGYDEDYVVDLIRRVSPETSERELDAIRQYIRSRSSGASLRVIMRIYGNRLTIEPRGYLGGVIDEIRGLL